jgi:predicted HTH transcriptional regulator
LEKKGVRIVVYKGVDKLDGDSDDHGKRGYYMAFENALKRIMQAIPSREELAHGIRRKNFNIPPVAIREILANAIVHQDFTVAGSGPVVEVFSDRVSITNPGKPLVDVDRFIDSPSRSRNPSFTDLMRRLGICEERGSGIDRAFTEIEDAGLPPPLVKVLGDSTVVTMFGPRKFADMTAEERIRGCYQHASLGVERSSFMSNSSLRKRFKLSDKQYPQVSKVIRESTEAGLIRPLSETQSNKNAKYVPYWYD